MTPVTIACIVEGHGETAALPALLRRMDAEGGLRVVVAGRVNRTTVVKPGELESQVEAAALSVRPRGAVLILLDSDDDCPKELAPKLLERAMLASIGLPVAVVLAEREFETWFVAAAESLAGHRNLPPALTCPANPERIRDAKGWLSSQMPANRPYSPPRDQPALAAIFDIPTARERAPSFDKFCREVERLIAHWHD
ncbi:MAG: DUF4276 family protein [Candidatus Solibacter sp.]